MLPALPTFAEDRLNAPQAAAFVGVAVQTLTGSARSALLCDEKGSCDAMA